MTGRAIRRAGRTPILLAWLTLTALLGVSGPAQANIVYHYDQLGRLRAVVDPASDTSTFTYDAVGNILSITYQPSSQVAIIEFDPKKGPVGTIVRILGTGYSATPGQDAVAFNGVAAPVSAASATELVVTVPAGATTGPIGVTAPGGSATSSEPFMVTADSGAPTITSFTPGIGVAGNSVSLSGVNFEPIPANNRLALNITRAQVTAATATSLGTKVPPKATSGHFAVATPGGSATSSAYFFVPPTPYTPADVILTDSMALGSSKTVTIGTANRVGLVVFDGTAGQRISLQMTAVTITYSAVTVYAPDGAQLGPQTFVNTGGAFYDVQTLPKTGTYQILVDPTSTYTGNMTLTLNNVPPDVTGPITPGGAAVGVTYTTVGQNAALTVSGTAGQRISVNFTNVTVSSSYASIYKPDGSNLVPSTPVFTFGGFIDATTLPVTGTYTLRIDPQGTATGSMTVTMYSVTDATGSITPGGAAVTVPLSTPGQNGQVTFTGTAGQRVGLNVGNITPLPMPAGLYVSIKKPDGSYVVSPVFMAGAGAFIDATTLPVTGTYTIIVDPNGAWTGSVTLTLYDVPADVTGTITPGGSAVTVTITAGGQKATLTFSGTASQRVSLRMTSVTIANSTVSILKPDTTTLTTFTGVGTGGAFVETQTLPTTGTYTIVVDPQGTATGSMTLTLYDVPADVTGTMTINGAGVGVTITTPGQNGTLTFSGTSGQQVTVRVTGNTIASLVTSLLKPDGGVLTSSGSGASSFNLVTQTLPTTGTYTVKVDPITYATGSLTVTVTSP